MNSIKMKKCTNMKVCDWMEERLDHGIKGKGFHALICLDETSLHEKEGRHYLYGVSYNGSAKDKGVIINYCPFCGGRPGKIHERSQIAEYAIGSSSASIEAGT